MEELTTGKMAKTMRKEAMAEKKMSPKAYKSHEKMEMKKLGKKGFARHEAAEKRAMKGAK